NTYIWHSDENIVRIGMDITHVITIFCSVPFFTPRTLCDVTTPKIEEEMTCVVLTGKSRKVAPNIISALDVSAATPFTGRIFIILPPTVLMILQPPMAVPKAIAVAQMTCTHV